MARSGVRRIGAAAGAMIVGHGDNKCARREEPMPRLTGLVEDAGAGPTETKLWPKAAAN